MLCPLTCISLPRTTSLTDREREKWGNVGNKGEHCKKEKKKMKEKEKKKTVELI